VRGTKEGQRETGMERCATQWKKLPLQQMLDAHITRARGSGRKGCTEKRREREREREREKEIEEGEEGREWGCVSKPKMT
jgi:hypothetical protein